MPPERFRGALAPSADLRAYKKFVAWLDEEFSDSHAELDAIIDDQVIPSWSARRFAGEGGKAVSLRPSHSGRSWAFANGQIVGGQGLRQQGRKPSKPPGCRSRRCRRRTSSCSIRLSRHGTGARDLDGYLELMDPESEWDRALREWKAVHFGAAKG